MQWQFRQWETKRLTLIQHISFTLPRFKLSPYSRLPYYPTSAVGWGVLWSVCSSFSLLLLSSHTFPLLQCGLPTGDHSLGISICSGVVPSVSCRGYLVQHHGAATPPALILMLLLLLLTLFVVSPSLHPAFFAISQICFHRGATHLSLHWVCFEAGENQLYPAQSSPWSLLTEVTPAVSMLPKPCHMLPIH